MAKKPTYEELEQRVKKLEEEILNSKQKEEALRENEERYRTAFEQSSDAIVIIDPETLRAIEFNDLAASMLGYTREEFARLRISDYEIIETSEEIKRHRDDLLVKGRGEFEIKMRTRDGQIKDVQVSIRVVEIAGRKLFHNIFRDITEHKHNEKALINAKEEWESTFDSVPDLIAIIDDKHRMVRVNRAIANKLGVSPDDAVGLTCYEYVHGTKEPPPFCPHAKLLSDGQEHLAEVHEERLGGIFQVSVTPLHDSEGRLTGSIHVAHDITERKRAEKALEESKERYALATRAAAVGVWDWNTQTDEFYLDPNIKAILGYSDDEIPNNLKIWATYVHPEDRQPVMEAFQSHLEGQTPEYVYKHRMLHKDGSVRWILVRGTAIRDKKGNAIRVVGTDVDITELMQVKKALAESESKFRVLADSTTSGIAIYTKDKLLYVNPAWEIISGYSKEEMFAANFWDILHPDMREMLRERAIARLRGHQEPSHYEAKIITKDGTTKWLDITAKRIEYAGQPAIINTSTDITERKQAEEALLKVHAELERLVKERTQELKIKTINLEEVNTALRVLLSKREEDKGNLERRVLSNVNSMILPLLDKLKGTILDEGQKTYIDVLESNIKEIISPFVRKLSSKYLNLTFREVQVANFIKQGMHTKEIASLLNVSVKTIESHREGIRKKIGITNRKTNLRSYLLSLN